MSRHRNHQRAWIALAAATGLAAAQAWPADMGSTGCGAAAATSGTDTMAHGGATRTYGLNLPAGYDAHRPARLVLAFHGWGGDEREFLGDTTVVKEASRRGYVVVAARGLGAGAPDHSNNSWTLLGSATGAVGTGSASTPICDVLITPDYTYPSCRSGRALNTCSWTQCQDDDVGFVSALIDHLEATLCIDTRHVFATGGSNGGMFTWELGMNPRTATRLRAIAPIIGLPHRGDLRPPGRPGGMPDRRQGATVQLRVRRGRVPQLLRSDGRCVAAGARLPGADGARVSAGLVVEAGDGFLRPSVTAIQIRRPPVMAMVSPVIYAAPAHRNTISSA